MTVKLKYVGNGEYLIMIPMRDLTDYDLERLSVAGSEDVEIIIERLANTPYYERHEEYTCAECGKIFKSWKALSKHELKHIEQLTNVTEIAEEDTNNG